VSFYQQTHAKQKEVKDETIPICEELQVSTEENPCRKDDVSVSTIVQTL
jgi:hypothetical protein